MRSPRRLMCSSVLGLECVVFALVTPVLIRVEDAQAPVAIAVGLGLAVAALLVAASLRFDAAYLIGFVIQVAALALGFILPVMFVLGLIFAALYTTAYVLGRRIELEQQKREAAAG